MRQATGRKTAPFAVCRALRWGEYADFRGANRLQGKWERHETSDRCGHSDPVTTSIAGYMPRKSLGKPTPSGRIAQESAHPSEVIAQEFAQKTAPSGVRKKSAADLRKCASGGHSGQFSPPMFGERRPMRRRFWSDFPHSCRGPSQGPDARIAPTRPSNSSENRPEGRRRFPGLKIALEERADHA